MLQQWGRVDYDKGRARLCRPPALSLHFPPSSIPSPQECGLCYSWDWAKFCWSKLTLILEKLIGLLWLKFVTTYFLRIAWCVIWVAGVREQIFRTNSLPLGVGVKLYSNQPTLPFQWLHSHSHPSYSHPATRMRPDTLENTGNSVCMSMKTKILAFRT